MLYAFDATTSLYAAIRSIGVVFASATERIETVLASPREATLVESTTSMPMLLLHRTSVDPEGLPIERVRLPSRGDRIAFLTTLREGWPATPQAPLHPDVVRQGARFVNTTQWTES